MVCTDSKYICKTVADLNSTYIGIPELELRLLIQLEYKGIKSRDKNPAIH